MYKIIFEGKAGRQLRRLPPPFFQRAERAIDALADDPRPPQATRLVSAPGYRLRIGDYRILYDVDDKAQVVTVYHVGDRKEVYRKK